MTARCGVGREGASRAQRRYELRLLIVPLHAGYRLRSYSGAYHLAARATHASHPWSRNPAGHPWPAPQGGAAPFGPLQVFTKVERWAPVRFFASACLLQAFKDIGFTGVALAPLGVAVVAGWGWSAAKAAPQPRTATAARAAVIFIQVSSSSGGPTAMRSGPHVRRGALSPS